jgi:hypothetical protein
LFLKLRLYSSLVPIRSTVLRYGGQICCIRAATWISCGTMSCRRCRVCS